jgi:hypothetical protein
MPPTVLTSNAPALSSNKPAQNIANAKSRCNNRSLVVI